MTYGCHASLTRPLSLEHLIYKHHTLIVRHTYNLGVQQNVFSYLLNSNFECKKNEHCLCLWFRVSCWKCLPQSELIDNFLWIDFLKERRDKIILQIPAFTYYLKNSFFVHPAAPQGLDNKRNSPHSLTREQEILLLLENFPSVFLSYICLKVNNYKGKYSTLPTISVCDEVVVEHHQAGFIHFHQITHRLS